MSLFHKCDVCGNPQKARLAAGGGLRLEDGTVITREDDPCGDCDAAAEEAKKEALEKRRKKEEE